jgi:predicted DNA-binding transcriptional regulator AlpA
MDELVGAHEIRVMLGISRQRVNQLLAGSRFPEPVARLAQGAVWRKRDIEQWMRDTGREAPVYPS